MIFDAFQVAAMTMTMMRSVEALVFHTRHLIVGRIAIAETVGHDEIYKIVGRNGAYPGAAIVGAARFEFVAELFGRWIAFKFQQYFAGSGPSVNEEIDG